MQTQGIPRHIRERVLARSGRVHPFDTMVPARTGLVAIDMQKHFMAVGAAGEVAQAREIVPAINRLAHLVRQSGGAVIWIRTVAANARETWPLYTDELLSPQVAARREQSLGGEGGDLWPELTIKPTDLHVDKIMFSALSPGSSNLLDVLRESGIDTLLIAGVATNICCETTARDAMMLNFRTTMVSDALAARSNEEHIGALATFYNVFGDVQTVDEVGVSLGNGSARQFA